MVAYVPYLLVALIVWGIVALVRHSRQVMAEQKQLLQELGFSELPTIDAELAARVNQLRNIGHGAVKITRGYVRHQGYYSLYFLSLWTGKKSDSSSQWAAAIVSRELDLPSFAISPAVPLKGKLGGWLNSLVNWAAQRRGMTRVAIPPASGCAETHYFFAEHPDLASSYFPLQFWERLKGDANRLMLEGHRDILLFWSMPGTDKESRRFNWVGRREAVRLRMDMADRIFGWLRECGKQAKKDQAGKLASVLDGLGRSA